MSNTSEPGQVDLIDETRCLDAYEYYDQGIGKNFNSPVVPSDETIRFVKKLALKKFRSSSPCWHCSCSPASTWTQTARVPIKTNPNLMILSTDIKKLKHNEAPTKAAKTRCSQCKGICHEVVTCSHGQNMSKHTRFSRQLDLWSMCEANGHNMQSNTENGSKKLGNWMEPYPNSTYIYLPTWHGPTCANDIRMYTYKFIVGLNNSTQVPPYGWFFREQLLGPRLLSQDTHI